MLPAGRLKLLAGCLAFALLASCSSANSPAPGGVSAPVARTSPVSLNKDDYPVFPDADAGADPSVSAEQGGKGFAGQGWETNTAFDFIGDPRAVKGGALRDSMLSFPGTLRVVGPEANTVENYVINTLVYEQLLNHHPTTLDYLPSLATHWKIDADKVTFHFRINPNARFSDGTPVTAEDAVATWKFLTDKGIDDLYYNQQYEKLEQPVAESKYVVRIKARKLDWENFEIAATMRVFPAHVLKEFDGKAYLKDYNFKYMPGTGPYVLNATDIEKGKSVTLHRRTDYWAEKARANVGLNNFDEYKLSVVRDDNLALEMVKKGDLDYFAIIGRPKMWAEQLNDEKFQRGLVVKRAVYNNYPAVTAYLAFNTRRKPWDDIRVRKAFALLLNREQMIEKLFYNQYLPQNTFFPATIYANPENPKSPYNPDEALKLLGEAGWKTRDREGHLTRDGRPLQVEMLYANKAHEQWLTVYQEDLRKVGINLNLRFVTPETRFKMVMQRQFDFASGGWGVGSPFPEPRPEYGSEGADRENTNNITGFKDKRIDELCDRYDKAFDPQERVKIIQELDRVLAEQYQYILRWYDPAQRIVYMNKFGVPQGTFSRIGDYMGDFLYGIPQMWWIDPEKAQKLDAAMKDSATKLEVPPVDDHYWQEYGQQQ